MVSLFDLVIFLFFGLAQWRISVLWLGYARRGTGWRRTTGIWSVRAFNTLLFAGCLFTFSDYMARMGITGRGITILGGAALLYCMTASAALAIYEISR